MPVTTPPEPLWLARVPRARRAAFPALRGEVRAEVAVVGGGAAGCFASYVLANAGCRVVLLEADRVGQGATARADGVLVPGPGPGFRDLWDRFGLRAARHVWETSRRATLDLMALLRRLRILCELAPADYLDLGLTDASRARLDRDYQALREAGLEASWLGPSRVRSSTGLLSAGEALKLAGGGCLDPYRASLGVLRQAVRLGTAVYERSPVRRIRGARRGVEVATASGTVHAERVVVTSGLPAPGFTALARHLRRTDECVVALAPLSAPHRRLFGASHGAVADAELSTRWHFARDGHLIVRKALGAPLPDRTRDALLPAHAAQVMYELSLRYHGISGLQPARRWLVRSTTAGDGIVVAGPHRNYPRHLFATGLGHGGLGAAYLAARVLARAHLGAPEKGDELFGFIR